MKPQQDFILTIIVAIIGSGLLNTFINRYFVNKDRKANENSLEKRSLKQLIYTTLSNKIEYVLCKNFATPEERHEIHMLHEVYKEWGWNGDMDARMDKVFNLRTDHAPHDE